MKAIYTAHATAINGRNGHAETDDKNLVVELSGTDTPKKSGPTTNPEQLFACAYAACFGSAVAAVAKQQKIVVSNVDVNSEVTMNQDDSGFFLSVVLSVAIPSITNATIEKLMHAAHQVCPYSKATRGNIEVHLKVNDRDMAKVA